MPPLRANVTILAQGRSLVEVGHVGAVTFHRDCSLDLGARSTIGRIIVLQAVTVPQQLLIILVAAFNAPWAEVLASQALLAEEGCRLALML